jgi:hypothetical protein
MSDKPHYPSNSYSSIDNPKKKPQKIATGKVQVKKKSFGERLLGALFSGSADDIKRHIVDDILIPGAKNAVSDTVDNLLYGTSRRAAKGRPNGVPYRSYDAYYNRSGKNDAAPTPSPRSVVEEIVFENRNDAIDVLNSLVCLIEDGQVASVEDYYTFAGMPSNHAQANWGWYSLSGSEVIQVRGGYIITLPKPIIID